VELNKNVTNVLKPTFQKTRQRLDYNQSNNRFKSLILNNLNENKQVPQTFRASSPHPPDFPSKRIEAS
jgi:hypothetical protein